MNRTVTALAWVLTRALTLWLFYGHEAWVTGDVSYFADNLGRLHEAGLAATLVEYPPPAVGVLAVPWLFSRLLGGLVPFSGLLMIAAMLTDAAFTVLLFRLGPVRRRTAALVVWLLAVPLLGATAYARFDLLPGVLVGTALLLLPTRPRLAAACVTVAAGVKLWPALVLPGMVAHARRRREPLLVVGAVGGVLVAASVVAAGWQRLLSPVTFQADRGLQVESVLATPAMVGWWLRPDRWQVRYAASNAYEVTGPGVAALVVAATVLTVLFVVALLALWWRAARSDPRPSVDAVVWLALAAVAAFMATGKVLSPQYFLWLLPAAAAGLAVVGPTRPALLRWSVLLLGATALTHGVFPLSYIGMVRPAPETARAVLLVLTRNALLVWLVADAGTRSWKALDTQRGSALERHPPGPESSGERSFR